MRYRTLAMIAVCAAGLNAQNLQDVIRKTEGENFESAAADFRALIAKEPSKGENYFYYGENFFKNDKEDSARIFYSKGIELNPTSPLNYVGMGKVMLSQGKVDDAKAQFYKAVSLSAGKNAEVHRRIAEAWLTTGSKSPDDALAAANAAIKIEPKNSDNYILLGDAQLEKNPTDGSTPVKSYQTATTLNPKSPKGLLRTGKLYQRGRNYQLALDYYKQALAIDPNFAPAYREIAEVYALYSQPAKAIENWKKYLELNNSNDARYRYMSALYLNRQYQEAVTEYESLKQAGFTNPYLERIAAYSYEELGDKTDKEAYRKGLEAIERFFSTAGQSFKYLASDYKYHGLLMIRNGQDSLGALEVEKAIAIDPNISADIYGKLAKVYVDAKNYDKAIFYLEKKRKGNFKNLSITDANDLGRAYYMLGQKQTDKAKMESMMKMVDSSFIRVQEVNPAYIMSYIFRGRANNSVNQNDSAKAHYEKVIAMVKPEEKTGTYKNQVVEALEFLGYYYVKTKNDAKAKELFTELKTIDPSNEKAKAYFTPPKQQKPAGKAPGKK